MATHDEVALSASQIASHWPLDNWSEVVSISIDAADGAPEPSISRFSMLGDSLMRDGINTEYLAQLLDRDSSAWARTDFISIENPWTIDWSPFSQSREIEIFDTYTEDGESAKNGEYFEDGEHSEDGESVCIQFDRNSDSLGHWLRMGFNRWCHRAMYYMERDWIDAWVFVPREPMF